MKPHLNAVWVNMNKKEGVGKRSQRSTRKVNNLEYGKKIKVLMHP